MAKHSPEPWSLDPKHLAIYSANGDCIADFWRKSNSPHGNAPKDDEAMANAVLAAAAPETVQQRDKLLEVANKTLDWLSSFLMPPTTTIEEKQEIMGQLQAVIANVNVT